jgi:hypothetical protein
MSRTLLCHVCLLVASAIAAAEPIPRPEHPTPDAVRTHWANLNGPWQFRFDPRDEGRAQGWSAPEAAGFSQTITVPFGWESLRSGIHKTDYRGVAWYRRTFQVPADFPKTDRVWLRFGAVDWLADVWVNGRHAVTHEGGYTPFQADITDMLKPGEPATLTVRAFDPTDPNLPTGKQVGWYTPTSGIWQTVWLESRPKAHIGPFRVVTAIDPATARFEVAVSGLPKGDSTITVRSSDPTVEPASATVTARGDEAECCSGPVEDAPLVAKLAVPVKQPRLWTPETPHLYPVTIELKTPDGQTDSLTSYFGLRTIARGRYGDAPFEQILLNGKPVYLRTALDQSFNPEGLYTAPDDDFLKRDLIIAKASGLNGLRIHIKPDEPRRLYWADQIGLLILEDMPNTWRQNATARKAWEKTMRETVVRDRNHPSIITWVAFNETWGLGRPEDYKADRDTQSWVGAMVSAIRKLDPTRLVEDNSPCNYDHVENTDLNSWHFYIDDHEAARKHIAEVVAKTRPGSGFNYCPGRVQGTAPLINSEYGGVSAGGGDRDVSWCFRDLTTLLRKEPMIQGYVYTELSDIEWEHNGFVNYDRSPKSFGYEEFLPDMRPNELNGADFVGYDSPPVIVGRPNERVSVPVFISHYSDRAGPPVLRWWVAGFDEKTDLLAVTSPLSVPARWEPYGVTRQEPVTFTLPPRPFVGALMLTLRDANNRRYAGNFVNIVVKPEKPLPRVERQGDREVVLRFAPGEFSRMSWSEPKPARMPRGKVYGRGKGFFEYHLHLPAAIVRARPESYEFRFEIASKAGREKVDWPSRVNRQDYPQTDTRKWPSTLEISLNGHAVAREQLEDDPADARGVLSHIAGIDHGSYGELIDGAGPIPDAVKDDLARGRALVVRFAVPDNAEHKGGLSLYGADTGQFPFDPTIVITTADPLPPDLGVDPDRPLTTEPIAASKPATTRE